MAKKKNEIIIPKWKLINFEEEQENLREFIKKEILGSWGSGLSGKFDGVAGDKISLKLKRSARIAFNIPNSAEILYINTRKCEDDIFTTGTVLTDKAIYSDVAQEDKEQEDNPLWIIPWINLFSCKYQEEIIFLNNAPYEVVKLFTFESSYYWVKEKNIGPAIEKSFNKIIEKANKIREACEKESAQRFSEIGEFIDAEDYQTAQELLDQNFADWDWRCHFAQGWICALQGKYDEALAASDRAENDPVLETYNYKLISRLRKACYWALGDYTKARHYSFLSTNEDFNDFEKQYLQHFYELPYNERKFIVPVEKIEDLDELPDDVVALDIHRLPKGMTFPMGRPIAGQVYVAHPLEPQRYIPLENYQWELLEDKIREFCYLAGSLGAKEVHVQSVSVISRKGKKTMAKGKNAGLLYKDFGARGEYDSKSKKYFEEKLEQITSISQKFLPKKAPALPKDLHWYYEDASWQRLYKQRMKGNMIEHNELIATNSVSFVSEEEFSQVNAGVSFLFWSFGGGKAEETQKQYRAQAQLEVTLNVKFAPLDSLPDAKKKNRKLPKH